MNLLLDLIVPRRCAGCDARLSSGWPRLCVLCEVSRLEPEPGCDVCGLPQAPGQDGGACAACLVKPPLQRRARWAAEYGCAIQNAIRRFKYGGREDVLTTLMTGSPPDVGDCDVIIPVPLHLWRRIRRGFNQAALVASHLSRITRIPVDYGALERVRATRPQARLAEIARRENIRGAFVARRPERIVGRRVLLVDDVVTTGATVDECTRVLRRAGARSVDIWSIARVI